MSKTQNLHQILNELNERLHLESKILEQKVFALWREHLGIPLGTKTVPVSLLDGTLKVYTEYPVFRVQLQFHKQKILDDLNAELGQSLITELQVELRQVRTSGSDETKHTPTSKTEASDSNTSNTDQVTPEKLEMIEQELTSVTDTQIKKSLRQLFITQSENKP
ncbi:MAG: DUF721 domain-containing protein [Candidatus Poribacteria bacterium]|nr:DUF721 domain-containing protein [Candidatus Poribacteria bacterium]